MAKLKIKVITLVNPNITDEDAAMLKRNLRRQEAILETNQGNFVTTITAHQSVRWVKNSGAVNIYVSFTLRGKRSTKLSVADYLRKKQKAK